MPVRISHGPFFCEPLSSPKEALQAGVLVHRAALAYYDQGVAHSVRVPGTGSGPEIAKSNGLNSFRGMGNQRLSRNRHCATLLTALSSYTARKARLICMLPAE
jgi:hypothetical protein